MFYGTDLSSEICLIVNEKRKIHKKMEPNIFGLFFLFDFEKEEKKTRLKIKQRKKSNM